MMDEKTFQEKLASLVREMDDLPAPERQKIEDLAAQARNRQAKMKQTITELTESLDYLRMSVKYLVFDLEATRRENKYLRRMLEHRTDEGADGDMGIEGDFDDDNK